MKAVKIQNSEECSPLLRTALQPSRKVSRSLFGPIDHDQCKKDLKTELEKDLKEKCELWSFDFFSGSPMKGGRYNWDCSRTTPSNTYSLPTELRQSSPAFVSVEKSPPKSPSSKQDKQVEINRSPCSAFYAPRSSSTSNNSPGAKRKRNQQQATITDYMKQKKRRRVSQSTYNEKVSEKLKSPGPSSSNKLLTTSTATVRTEQVTC